MAESIRIVVLGGPGVGKSGMPSIIFILNFILIFSQLI